MYRANLTPLKGVANARHIARSIGGATERLVERGVFNKALAYNFVFGGVDIEGAFDKLILPSFLSHISSPS